MDTFGWFDSLSKNWVNPLLANKKLTLLILALFVPSAYFNYETYFAAKPVAEVVPLKIEGLPLILEKETPHTHPDIMKKLDELIDKVSGVQKDFNIHMKFHS